MAAHSDWLIVEASSGEEALGHLQQHKPDAITMDLNMLGISGLEAATKILAIYPATRIALMTANVQESTQKKAESLGLAFLRKPITEASVKQAFDFFQSAPQASPDQQRTEFSADELDAFTEIFNIGIGHAAASLSQMVGHEIILSVPRLTFSPRSTATRNLTEQAGQKICAVKQSFRGSFNTDAILMFPEHKSMELVSVMVGGHVPLEQLGEMEQEAMSEIGNIILNSVIGTVADLLHAQLESSLPSFESGSSEEILSDDTTSAHAIILMLHINFHIERMETRGYLAFLLDIPSLDSLKESIQRFLNELPPSLS